MWLVIHWLNIRWSLGSRERCQSGRKLEKNFTFETWSTTASICSTNRMSDTVLPNKCIFRYVYIYHHILSLGMMSPAMTWLCMSLFCLTSSMTLLCDAMFITSLYDVISNFTMLYFLLWQHTKCKNSERDVIPNWFHHMYWFVRLSLVIQN